MGFLEKLKNRWGIAKNIQVVLILISFAVAGSLTVIVTGKLSPLIGIEENASLGMKILAFVILTLPVYNLILIATGSILGQHTFFKKFIITFFKRIFRLK